MAYADEWDPDYDLYLDTLAAENDFGPYSEEYSKRPLPDEMGPTGGSNHHPECESPDGNPYSEDCTCRQLYERDYHEQEDQEAEEMHQEYWQ